MSGRVTSVSEALELLAPPFVDVNGDWDEIIRRAVFASPDTPTREGRPRRRWKRRRVLIIAIAVAVIVTLAATPAFGLRGLITGWFDRTDVPFTGKSAPLVVKRDFFDLSLGLPPSIAPQAIASQVRRVATFRLGTSTRVLWIAPTRDGGYCYTFTHTFGGCRTTHDRRLAPPRHVAPGYVHPELLGVSFSKPSRNKVQYVERIGGDVRTARAYSLTVRYADGTRTPVRFYFVSKPIDAGFFLERITGHDTVETRAIAVELRDRSGRLLARQPFGYPTAAERAAQRAHEQAMLKLLKRMGHGPLPVLRPKPLPPPTSPLQHGSADGVTVVVGHNRVAVFDSTSAPASVRALIAGRRVGYYCFRKLPYHSSPVDLGASVTTFARVAIRIDGAAPPFLGCEIQGNYGHSWPDRLHGHSAVEIALTQEARRFFADRAAARDLALFVRSREMHRIRKLTGNSLEQAIRTRYGSTVTAIGTVGSALPAGRIGYMPGSDGSTFVERSTTGRSFYVRIRNGRIDGQNVKPLGFVF